MKLNKHEMSDAYTAKCRKVRELKAFIADLWSAYDFQTRGWNSAQKLNLKRKLDELGIERMSKFIIECDYDHDDDWISGEYKEEIVRCRDCKHMFDWAYDRPMCKLWAMNDPNNSNASYGNALYPVVKPDGYCAWGERKEGGE